MGESDPRKTPAMQQYFRFKERHPGCVLLFRMGDFYETFDQDAVTISKALGLTLTQRTAGLPMAGVPYHQLEVYLRRLIQQGFRVAVAEQLQDPKEARGLVERGVTRVVTPGTLVDDALLRDDSPCTLAAVCFIEAGEDAHAGLAVVEVSTGSFVVLDCPAGEVVDELVRRGVSEVLYSPTADDKAPPRVQRVLGALGISGTARPPWQFRGDEARRVLSEHFGVATLAGFGLSEDDPALPAAGAVVAYLKQTQTMGDSAPDGPFKGRRPTLSHLRPPRREDPAGFCVIDAVSLRSLEVERTIRPTGAHDGALGVRDASLLGLLLATPSAFRTAMGKRLLRDWLCRPLAAVAPIRARQRAIAALVEDRRSAEELRVALDGVQDIARIAGRVALARVTPRDLVALGRSLSQGATFSAVAGPCPALAEHAARIDGARQEFEGFARAVLESCVESPPPHLREGGLFKAGVDAELDAARAMETDGSSFLVAYQERLARELDLPGLKVGYNKVFGYYIELSSSQARAFHARGVATALTRKQTLKNAERYTTPDLAELEAKITGAQARALERERELFEALCGRAAACIPAISAFAQAVAELDAFHGLAERAHRRGWRCPEIVEGPTLVVHAGRHPVLEELLGSEFVPNDVELGVIPGAGSSTDSDSDTPTLRHSVTPSLSLITGPNMAGKSTFIRQTALIVLLAHTGSFVPADRATIGVTDRIFTRIGADDALHAGQSTFMVEMTETANILNHVTERSLVILDEIGRGTSTLDGLSLAWAIAEHLAGGSDGVTESRSDEVREPPNSAGLPHSVTPSLRHFAASSPRTLFATHYHELTDLEDRLPGRVANLHVAVREWPGADGHGEIIFLHRIMPGRSDQSYGIHVAKLAGIPRDVIERAREVLASLEVQHGPATGKRVSVPAPANGQLSLFTEYLTHPAVDQLRELKLDSLTPLEAFDTLRRLKQTTQDR